MAFGGPSEYSGRDLRDSHASSVKRGLGDHHFDRVAELLDESLAELGVAEEARAEVLSVVGGTREDVLGR